MVIFEFEYGTNMDRAVIDMNNKMGTATASMDDAVGTPILMQINPDMLPVMVAAVDVEGLDLAEASALIEDSVIPAFERIDGVASVTGMGLLEQRVQVTLDQERIDELNQRVLRAVDADLADAQEQLEAGKQKIADGRAELSRQRKTQTQKLDEAQEQLEAGRPGSAQNRQANRRGRPGCAAGSDRRAAESGTRSAR